MKERLSDHTAFLTQSPIRYMTLACAERKGINLSQGVCDMAMPESVAAAAVEAINAGFNSYSRCDGADELRRAIAEKSRRHNDIQCDPDKEVVVSCGATGAFHVAALALLSPGDEVIVFEPYYEYHVNLLKVMGVKSVFVKMTPPDWSYSLEELERAIGPRTRAVLVNTPGNPSGKVFDVEELKVLGELCVRRDLLILTDEIYEYFVYDGKRHVSPASLPELRGRTITISGFSKTFSATGWRVGYCVCHEAFAERIAALNDLIYICAPTPLQLAVAEGIRSLGDDYYESTRTKFENHRDEICAALNDVGLTPFVPRGAYYILMDASNVPGATSRDKAMWILDQTGVALVPGAAFFKGDAGENILRLCFAKEDDVLKHACDRLRKLHL